MPAPKTFFVKLFALAVCALPPAAVTLGYFPIWKERGSGALISGFTVLILLIAFTPLTRAIKSYLKSPSAFGIWLLLFVGFMLIKSIAYEMSVISFVGMISNLFGAIIFKIARREVKDEKLPSV